MDSYRLKMRIGPHEFEAEGPPDAVQKQFEAFKELIASGVVPNVVAAVGSAAGTATVAGVGEAVTAAPEAPQTPDASLGKIMRTDGRVVSLTVQPRNFDEAVLLLLFGQQVLRENTAVSGAEVMDGLESSGPSPIRADRILSRASDAGDIIVFGGTGRSRRYRLTNAGLTKARAIAAGLLSSIP